MKRIQILTIIFIFTIALSSSCSKSSKQHSGHNSFHEMPIEVESTKVKTSSFNKSVLSVGEISSPQSTIISSEIEGRITYLNIPEGKNIDKGHVLVKVNDLTSMANLKIEEVKLNNAKIEYERIKKLNIEGAVSNQTLEKAERDLDVAEATVESYNSEDIKTNIVAPFNGKLSFKKVSLGTVIMPGDEIVRITQTYPLDLIFSLPEKYVSSIKEGQTLKFTLEKNDKKYTAKIVAIDPYINPENRAVLIKATILENSKELLPGRFVTVNLATENKLNAIQIPQEAIIQEGNTNKVFIIKNNIAEVKNIEIGDWSENTVEILKGLNTGDEVVTLGHQKIKSGSKVITKSSKEINNLKTGNKN